MRLIQVLLVTLLVFAPVVSFAKEDVSRSVASEKSAKAKKGSKGDKKAKKAAKGKKEGKAKAAKAGKKAKGTKAAAKGKKVKAKKVARAKTHAPADLHAPGLDDGSQDPASNFEVSPELQDDLPAPNNGNLTD